MTQTQSKLRILVVDDDKSFLSLFVQEAKIRGRDLNFDIITANSGNEALEVADRFALDAVISDVQMPGLDGMDLFYKFSIRFPGLPVILLTAFGSIDKAIEAIKMGAYHYFQKPVSDPELFWRTVVEAATKKRAMDELDTYHQELDRSGASNQLIGSSPPWQEITDAVERVAALPSTVLITGETGTGKEVVARAIHRLSSRSDRPFVAASCIEFSGSLLEAELFGHERGAFTGALAQRRGIFERAHGGTLFLDEIAETSHEAQVKLLRVLEGSPFFRVGGQEALKSDFRLIAATNRELELEVREERFRRDLYYRLAVYPIHLPPLRERSDDILPLALHFLDKKTHQLGRPPKTLSGSALTYLCRHDWPGNVRELENLIERAVITSTGPEVQPSDIFPSAPSEDKPNAGLNLENMERLLINLALERSGYNKSHTADLLGIARKTLADKMTRLGIKEKPPL